MSISLLESFYPEQCLKLQRVQLNFSGRNFDLKVYTYPVNGLNLIKKK